MNQSENLVKESLSAEGNYLVLTNLDKSGLSKRQSYYAWGLVL